MCGIAGFYDPSCLPSRREETVTAMSRVQRRRGPDDDGIHSWDRVTFGHRRLSVFDTSSAGHQPMVSPDGRRGITFNGAIYNFRDLRALLEQAGYAFVGRSDTEVILHGYDHWGIDGLVERLHGMFAFAIYDADSDVLHLVRDRLGVKPLLYVQRGRALHFASTCRALQRAGTLDAIDPAGVVAMLSVGHLADDEAMYEGLVKLPAGTRAELRDGRLTARRYWNPQQPIRRVSFREAVEETEHRLKVAVTQRLVADVPVAVLLSSGIDSTLISWAVAQAGADLVAYTVGVPNDPTDETEAARQTAARLGLRHRVLPMTEVSFDDLDRLVDAFCEPFAIESALGMLHVAEAMGERAKVVLTGDGGDDVFLGYPRHRHLLLAGMLGRALPPAAGPLWRGLRPKLAPRGLARRLASFVDYSVEGLGAYQAAMERAAFLRRRGVLGDGRLTQALADRNANRSPSHTSNLLGAYLDHAYATQLVGEYLPKVDGATMYYGLEARSPLLDTSLWEYASGLPYSVRMHFGEPKALLRAIARRHLGRAIADRPKQGFMVPVRRWLTEHWREPATEVIGDSLLARDGWVDADAWRRAHLSFPPGHTQPEALWRLLVLEKWYRREPVRATHSAGTSA